MSDTVKEEFLLLYYEWARQDFAREVQQGWPFLKRLPSSSSFRWLKLIESMGVDAREDLIRAMLKRFHPVAVKFLGDEMTARETEVFEAASLVRMYPHQEEEAFTSKGRMNRRKFMRHAQEALRPILGTDVQEAAPDEDWYFTAIGPARVKTVANYEKEPSCDHRLFVGDKQIFRGASILSWLGISSGTEFDMVPRGEEEQAAELLAELCGHYLTAVRDIVGRMTTLS